MEELYYYLQDHGFSLKKNRKGFEFPIENINDFEIQVRIIECGNGFIWKAKDINQKLKDFNEKLCEKMNKFVKLRKFWKFQSLVTFKQEIPLNFVKIVKINKLFIEAAEGLIRENSIEKESGDLLREGSEVSSGKKSIEVPEDLLREDSEVFIGKNIIKEKPEDFLKQNAFPSKNMLFKVDKDRFKEMFFKEPISFLVKCIVLVKVTEFTYEIYVIGGKNWTIKKYLPTNEPLPVIKEVITKHDNFKETLMHMIEKFIEKFLMAKNISTGPNRTLSDSQKSN